MKLYYLCNPHKHTKCTKVNCHTTGGSCKHTTDINYAQQPVELAFVVIDIEEGMLDE